MRAEEITEDNVELFDEFLSPEEAENIGRDTYRGVAVTEDDGSIGAGAIWEIKYSEDDEKDTVSRISWLTIADTDFEEPLFEAYSEMIRDEDVEISEFELSPSLIDENIFKKYGFEISEKEDSNIIITVGDLAQLKLMHLNKVIPTYVTPLSEIKERDFKRGLMNCIFHSKRELTEDLSSLPLEWYEPNLSCYVTTDGKIEGYLLVHLTSTGKLRVELLIDVGFDSQMELLNMVRFSMKQAVNNYPPETTIILHRSDNASSKLVSFLFPDAKAETVLAGNRKENA